MNFPYVHLPYSFTYLLQINMQSTGKNFVGLGQYLYQNPELLGLIERCIHKSQKTLRIEALIKSHGWHGIRNQLASIFVEKLLKGTFPSGPNLKLVEELIEFETNLRPYFPEGVSRAFLMGFYLKMGQIQQNQIGSQDDSFLFRPEDFESLAFSRARVDQIDWLLLMMKHFSKYIDKITLVKALKEGKSYQDFYSVLTDEQKSEMSQNMLSYGASIGEESIFLAKEV